MSGDRFPNLQAIIDGRVSGNVTEWTMVRIELSQLFYSEANLTRILNEIEITNEWKASDEGPAIRAMDRPTLREPVEMLARSGLVLALARQMPGGSLMARPEFKSGPKDGYIRELIREARRVKR